MWEWLKEILGVDVGTFSVGHGRHEVVVEVPFVPSNVAVAYHESGEQACDQCGGTQVGWRTEENIIRFTADVTADHALVIWVAS